MRATRVLAGAVVLLLAGACGDGTPPVLVVTVASTTTTSTTVPATTTTSEAPRRVVRASRKLTAPRVRAGCLAGVRFCWTDDPFDALSACEAGMNPKRVSASGKYMGAFQWDLSSWRGLGESGKPTDYDYAYQKQVALRMQAARGWRPWPTCARKLGLL